MLKPHTGSNRHEPPESHENSPSLLGGTRTASILAVETSIDLPLARILVLFFLTKRARSGRPSRTQESGNSYEIDASPFPFKVPCRAGYGADTALSLPVWSRH